MEAERNAKVLTHYDEAVFGKILWQAARSKWWIVPTSLLYALLSAVLILYAMAQAWWFYIPVAIVVSFFLWRIYEVHQPVVLVTEKMLLVTNGYTWEKGAGYFPKREYLAVSYKEIVGFSHRFTEMTVGEPTYGGLAQISVPFAFLSPSDKQKLVSYIEEKQGNAS